VIAALFAWSVALQGWTYVLVQDDFDISYFAFAHTFLIWVVARFGAPSAPALPARPAA